MSGMRRRDFITAVPASAVAAKLLARGRAASGAEGRAVWLHYSRVDANPAKGKEQVHSMVQKLAEHNFNLILPAVTDDYLVALDHPEYLESQPFAKWDWLGVLIDEAGRAGLAVHMWYLFMEYHDRQNSPFDPRVGGNPEWAALRLDEYRPDPKTGKLAPRTWSDICTQHPEARQWMLGLLRKAIARYPRLAGIHIEEPGYTYPTGYCVCDLCRKIFPMNYGGPLPDALSTPEAEDFRTLGPSFFMEELRDILKNHPDLVFSTNGGPFWKGDREKGRDWFRWAHEGWLDYYASQCYTPQTAQFRREIGTTIKDLNPDCPVYAGIAFRWSGGGNTVAEINRQIEVSRDLGSAGVCLFYADAITKELYTALKNGPFRSPAKLPRPARLRA
jgi:uncharacterized lipoprotein YddW (UPF0748 family)